MNAKVSVFVSFVEANIYLLLLLYNLDDCAFKRLLLNDLPVDCLFLFHIYYYNSKIQEWLIENHYMIGFLLFEVNYGKFGYSKKYLARKYLALK